ncbi:DUF2513 domain-containing protein [Pseudaestuariivita rosea]|uniref:DUF2513 domain-containing protein n=1 Tax=Pseudaestuariivita rosea TaxID=2763263 RepID=UPI001ABADCF8|nr:DUF2513 domain-containing protein [Pseudaestuariivita rosea]
MPKRNLDRIRELLLMAEETELDPDDDFNSGYIDLMSQISPEDGYQLLLMRDERLIEGKDANLGLFRLTAAGHNYLDSMRDEGVWSKTKKAVAETGGNATLEIVKKIAVGFLEKKIEDKTGLKL